ALGPAPFHHLPARRACGDDRGGDPRARRSGARGTGSLRGAPGRGEGDAGGVPPHPLRDLDPSAAPRSRQPRERVREHVVRYAPALGDALGLVEGPVDTEVDAALAILLL